MQVRWECSKARFNFGHTLNPSNMKTPVVLLCMALLLSSCSGYYYVQNTHNVPLFMEKNEARISGSLAGGEQTESYEVQGAYSITNHVAVAVSAMSTSGGSVNYDYGKGIYIDAAVGYYRPFYNRFIFEAFGGFGISEQKHEFAEGYSYNEGWARLSFNKIYLQPSFGISLFDAFDVAFSTRIGLLNYYNISFKTEDTFIVEDMEALQSRTHIVLEPAITVRGGWKYFKIQTQLAYVENGNSSDLGIADELHFSVGLYLSLSKSFNR
jgi:hypothetical protein